MVGAGVGIGTTAPSAALQIKSATTAMRITGNLTNASTRPAVSATPGAFEFRGSSASGDSYDDGFLRLSAGGGFNTNQQAYIDLSAYSSVTDMDKNIVFGTAGVERMRITAAGNVGIGTTVPNAALHIYGPSQNTLLSDNYILNVTSASSFNGNGSTTVYSNSINFQAGDLTGMASPSRGAQLYIGGGYSINGATNHGQIIMYTGATERMRVATNGNVGIGMASPIYKLDVNGTTNTVEALTISNASTATNGFLRILTFGGVNYIQSGLTSTADSKTDLVFTSIFAGTEWLRIKSTGNVGIGKTNPGEKLDVSGGVKATNGFYSYNTSFSYYSGNADWNTQSIFGDPSAWPWGGNTFLVTLRGPTSINGNAVRASFIVFHSRNTATTDDYGQIIQLSSTYVSYGISNYALRFTFNSPYAQVVNINILVLN
jgi:hypothetical protein